MKLKLDDKGSVVVQDGKPVYTHDDGSEHPFDAVATVATIKARNAEAKTNRERYEAAETKLKAFEGIEPDDARKAIDTVKNYDSAKSKDAQEFERRLAESNKGWQEKLDAANKTATEAGRKLDEKIVGDAFLRSKYITDKLAVPADMVQATFGRNFKVENGQLVAVDANGNPIMSKANPGTNATFDEACEILVQGYAHKDAILKATNGSGGGTPSNGGGGGGGKKSVSRAQFDALDPKARADHFANGGTVTD